MPDSSDTKSVRASEQLDWDKLADYLRAHLPDVIGDGFLTDAPLSVEQFPGGHSNLTYLVCLGAKEFVMRRPPLGRLPPKAHDMGREFHILEIVHPVFPLAPRPILLCEDAEIIGATFYIMERRRGRIVRHEEPAGLMNNPLSRGRVSEAVIDALADLHSIDAAANRLLALGKPAGFVERQVRGWSERWRGSQTTELPEMDSLAIWLMEHLPVDTQQPTMVHGDYKLDNVMLDMNDVGRVVGVFDWEMSAVGDALIDVGILLCYWVHIACESQTDAIGTVTQRAGYFTRDEILFRYAARTGNDLSNINFYEVFAVFKLAVVIQQIFYRYHRGQTDDARFAALDKRVAGFARIAVSLAEKA
ncbi:MAG: phosphotransferase family protein [Pyrinomonadaceae bacterium MAG19_C2-C3]|nr:phosphotransferase family protein [Pyrinomonadaceae bacterium MAG19_C2-C3]